MKKNNMTKKYDGTALFGSIIRSLFTPIKDTRRPKKEGYVPINLRRA
ncbi:MAG: hypothetical protein ACFFB5_07980 [Promethearchaeota archaeon]